MDPSDFAPSQLYQLILNLNYNSFITTYLELTGHLGKADIEAMDELHKTKGNATAVSELLRILAGRQESYAALLEAARQVGQTKAVAILELLSSKALTVPDYDSYF